MAVWKRPTVDTKFHIDYDWWQNSGRDVRVAVRGQLCRECQDRFADHRNTEMVDWVDPDTAEVQRGDALIQCLRSECAKRTDFISRVNPLVTNIFRVFLLNGNQALSPNELVQEMPWAGADVVLRTLTSGTVYMGLRPTTTAD